MRLQSFEERERGKTIAVYTLASAALSKVFVLLEGGDVQSMVALGTD